MSLVRALTAGVLVNGLLTCLAPAHAQTYPTRPIRLIMTGSAGGAPNVINRAVGAQLERQVGQPLVVESRAGATGVIAAEAVARSAPDGYTLLNVTSGFVILPSMRRTLPYDTFKDFVPVVNVVLGTGYLVMVNPSVKAASLKELIALAKASPKSIAYGSPGVGNSLHLATEILSNAAGIEMLHVPYKGAAPSITGLLGGEIQLLVAPPAATVSHIKAGKVRAIGYTGDSRWAEMPDVPAVAEALPGFTMAGGWIGWLGPAAMPREIIARLNAEVIKASHVPQVRKSIQAAGYEPDNRSPGEFEKFMRLEAQRFAEAVRSAKIPLED